MSRTKREKSKTNIYHIMGRGLNKILLFENDRDYLKFLQILNEVKLEYKFKIYAYCLMDNHWHMVIKDCQNNLSKAINIICQRYAIYYNKKNRRIGYVFNDRFHSEAINNKEYFYTCIRYIHQNPLKAFLCKKIHDYKYTSIHAYRAEKGNYLKLVDTADVYKNVKKDEFIKWNSEKNHDRCMEAIDNLISDKDANKLLYKVLNVSNRKEFNELSESEKVIGILELLDYGIQIMQLVRITGLSYRKIQRLKKGQYGEVRSLTYK